MGNKICVCDGDSHNEKESNIFSILSKTNTNKNEELKTSALENKATQGSFYKSFLDDNTSLNNNKLDNFLNEIYKSSNNSRKIVEEIIPENTKEDNNFHCSGKFEFPKNNIINTIPNGKTNIEVNTINNRESKEINDNGKDNLKNNQFGFVSFKSLIVDNNHNIHLKDNIQNKDNNMTISNEYNKIKESDVNKSEKKNNNINELIKLNVNKNNENGNPLNERNMNYSQLRYNDISKYSDVSDEDYLNYESNYTNSNKREENRDEQSLFDEN